MNKMNTSYDWNQNGQTVENQLYYTNDFRIQQYKASVLDTNYKRI